MDCASFCRGVVCRGVPGMNTVIIGAVPALCETAPIMCHHPELTTAAVGLRALKVKKKAAVWAP